MDLAHHETEVLEELVAANAQPEPQPEPTVPAEAVKELLFKLQADEALDVLKEAVAQLATWHQNTAAECDDPKQAAAWSVDEGRLHVCLLALNEVTL